MLFWWAIVMNIWLWSCVFPKAGSMELSGRVKLRASVSFSLQQHEHSSCLECNSWSSHRGKKAGNSVTYTDPQPQDLSNMSTTGMQCWHILSKPHLLKSLLDGFVGMKVETIIVSGGGGCKLVREMRQLYFPWITTWIFIDTGFLQ